MRCAAREEESKEGTRCASIADLEEGSPLSVTCRPAASNVLGAVPANAQPVAHGIEGHSDSQSTTGKRRPASDHEVELG